MKHETRPERRYTLHVTPAAHGDGWGVRLKLTDAGGTVINSATVSDVVFPTATDAEVAGWHLADEWISRLTTVSGPADAEPLAAEERSLLIGCDHAVARCDACRLHHRLFELYADRFCARCRVDLTVAVRRHLRECPEIVIRRSEAVGATMHVALKENHRIRDAADVTRIESEALRQEAQRTRARRTKPAGGLCRVCDRAVDPGSPVSFRNGAIVHLACYERSLS